MKSLIILLIVVVIFPFKVVTQASDNLASQINLSIEVHKIIDCDQAYFPLPGDTIIATRPVY